MKRCIDAYVETQSSALPRRSNEIGSHIVFKVEEEEEDNLVLKVRKILQGQRNRDRFSVRRNSASAELSAVRLVLDLAQILNFRILTADVTGAYMQSGLIHRELYVTHPKQLGLNQDSFQKLQKKPYVIVKAGRQRQCAVEN